MGKMKFAVINNSLNVEIIFNDLTQADEYRMEEMEQGDNWSVKPIMSVEDWMNLHKDFRGIIDGRPACVYYDQGTVLGYVYLIDAWDAYQTWTGKRYSEYIHVEGGEPDADTQSTTD